MSEPETYVAAPTPPAPVRDSGIGTAPIVPEEREFVSLSPTDRALIASLAAQQVTAVAEFEKRKILARFERRNLAPETVKAIENSTSVFRSTAKYILEVTQPGREQSAALTALEEAKMWTNQAVALHGAP